MFNKRLLVATSLAVFFLASVPADAWRHRMTTTMTAEKNAERHRRELQHSFAVPVPNEGSTWLCAAYERNLQHSLRNKGNNVVDFEINRFGGNFPDTAAIEVEEASVRATVKNNQLVACVKTNKPLDRNDVIIATHTFNKAPRLRSDEDDAEVIVYTEISNKRLDADDFFPPPPPPPPPCPDGGGGNGGGNGGGGDGGGDGGGGGGDGGGGGGGGNATNNHTAAQTLRGCATSSIGVQFQWDKGRLFVDRRVGGQITTIGPFNSFAEAANSAKSRWSCGAGNSVSVADGNEMPRLSGWGGVSGRRLALRFEKTGGSQVYVDAWSSSTGAIHGPAQGSVGAAIRNFCARSDISC